MADSSVYNLRELGYSQILKYNMDLAKTVTGRDFAIDILSNIIVNPIKEVLELSIRSQSLNPVIKFGNYDNIVQETFTVGHTDLVIIFYELINLSENFHLHAELLSSDETEEMISKCKRDIDIIFTNLSTKPLVLFNTFSAYPLTGIIHNKRNLDHIERSLNQYLYENRPTNVQLVDINRILTSVGTKEALDKKKFLKYKSLYKIEFLKGYVAALENQLLRRAGKLKKALIFDCDNTLWKGVIGEDGPEAIDMSPKSDVGTHYHSVQKIAAGLSAKGVLICLCSKNNPAEVEGLLGKHPDMGLNKDQIVAMKVNWNNKDENLKALAKELNIGLDSFVFVDDSEFEINLIKNSLPDVVTVTVPKDITEYPAMIMELAQRYFNLEPLKEDLNKVKAYKDQALRTDAMNSIGNIDAYLATLETKVVISANNLEQVPRIAQLTQKTNQFNLTTKRYAEADISNFMGDPRAAVFTIDVSDKFGESGITGVAIIKESPVDETVMEIDSYLLSCRILGRKIEVAFLDAVLTYCKNKNYKTVRSKYLHTAKNSQVKDFYADHQFNVIGQSDEEATYELKTENYKEETVAFINLIQDQHKIKHGTTTA